MLRDRSQTLVRGADAKNIYRENFSGPPYRPQKNFRPPFLPWKLRVNPIEKHVNSIFNGKSVVIFFQGPPGPYKGQKFQCPPFCISPPYKCLWTVPYWYLVLLYRYKGPLYSYIQKSTSIPHMHSKERWANTNKQKWNTKQNKTEQNKRKQKQK